MEHLTVTCIKPIRGFLQIYGHKKPDLLDQLESEISAYQPFTKRIVSLPELHPNLEFDTIYLALSIGQNKYHRCIVREKRPNNKVIIELIDYGNDFEVDTSLLLELDPQNKKAEFLRVFPPIATKYILANFFCNWKMNERDIIDQLVSKSILPITNEQMDREHRFISLDYDGIDVATKLINSHVGMEISFTEQRMEIRKIFQRSYDVFASGSANGNGGSSPARREKRRNLVPNRPLQTATNNNNTINNQGKRMIQNYLATNATRGSLQPENNTNEGNIATTAGRLPAFTANELAVGPFHIVYCPYIEDGPNLFSVQLKSQEHILDRMMSELSDAPRNPITTKVGTGMACIARFSEDRILYRAVIQNVQAEGCRVTFIDYGNSEFVPFSEMFEIPMYFLDYKTFAMSFQLNGSKELGVINDRLKEYFASLVTNDNVLELRVVPSNNVQVQQCELFISNGQNVLNLLKAKKNELSSFPSVPPLKDGDMVVIRAALTAKKFYVQRVKDVPQFDVMMDLLLAHCIKAPPLTSLPAKGSCCAAMVDGDNKEWYRSIVLDQIDSQRVKVQFVDFGHEMECRLTHLRNITPQFLELPRLAIECCLIHFEDVTEVSETTSKQLCMLVDDSNRHPIEYRATVRRQLPNNSYIVDLINEARDLSVSLSVYKLAMPRRQYNNKLPKLNETEKITRSTQNNRTNLQNVRECDGAENHDNFMETNVSGDRPRERYSNRNTADERAKTTKQRNEPTNLAPRNFGNRPEFENHRNNDANKKSILQKHIIPRFSKRANRSRNNHNGKRMIGVDKNDNWECTDGNSLSGIQCIDLTSKSPEKVVNKPKFAPITTECFVGLNPILPDAIPLLNATVKVAITHWTSPCEFFVQLKSMENICDEMMHQIQNYYQKRAPIQRKVPIGSVVLVRHKDDNVIKRARIIDYNEARDKYRVQFIDFGNKALCVLSDIFEMEKSFTRLPAMAMCCTLEHVILNKSLTEIQEKMSKYGDFENIDCNVLRMDQEKNIVQVQINGADLKVLMTRDNLIINLPKDICLESMVGQTLMAFITSVTDFSRFQATFYNCDIAFMCSYKDLSLVKKNPQLCEHLRAAEKQHVQVKIESVGANNVLILSIYLPHLDQDNGLSDVCSYPIFNNHFDGDVTNFESPYIYVENKAYKDQAHQLMDDLNNDYDYEGVICLTPKLHKTYVAASTYDGNNYRCHVEEIRGDEVLVRWIDYGYTEVIKNTSIKELDDKFKAPISVFARKMLIPVQFLDGSEISFLDWAVPFKVNILGTYQTNYVSDIIISGESMFKSLEDSNKAKRLNFDELQAFLEASKVEQEQQSNANESAGTQNEAELVAAIEKVVSLNEKVEICFTVKEDKPDSSPNESENTVNAASVCEDNVTTHVAPVERELAFITHVDSPNRFYMQLNSDTEPLEVLQQSLQIIAPQLPVLSEFRAGQLCIGHYSADDQWYRAKIIDTDGEITSIQFIDYGNKDSITNNMLLKSPDSNLNAREPFAMACSLPIGPCGSRDWSENACNKLRMLSNDSPLEFELISKDKDVNYIKIFLIGGRDIVKELIQEEEADPLEIIKSGEKCFISHINSLHDFFIQVDSDSDVLQKIELHLKSDQNSTILTTATVGTICSTKFADGQFYRARIIEVLAESTGYEVVFLDYGNTFVATEIRSLSSDIVQLPHLRKRCRLKMPDNIVGWSDDAEKQFREISHDGETKFKVNLVKPGKKATVELYVNDKNISDALIELCEEKRISHEKVSTHQHAISVSSFPNGVHDCLLTHVNSPADFYINFMSKNEDLKLIVQELERTDANDAIDNNQIEVGSIVAALFPDDGCFYRGKVLEKTAEGARVFFIDYGKNCLVYKMRKLPSILSTITPLAVPCTLAADKLAEFTPADTDRFIGFMNELPEPTFQAEAINTTVTKSTVQFYRDYYDILEYINHTN